MNTSAFPVLISRHGGLQIIRALQAKDVELLIVGSTALAYYNIRDLLEVGDLDLLVSPNNEAVQGVKAALLSLGLNFSNDEADWHHPHRRHIPVKSSIYNCDILSASSADEFQELAQAAVAIQIQNTTVRIASLPTLERLLEMAIGHGDTNDIRLRDLAKLREGSK